MGFEGDGEYASVREFHKRQKGMTDEMREFHKEMMFELPKIRQMKFVPGKKVLRLGVDSPVGISKTLYGRYVHYKVKYVVISIVKQPYTLEDGTELMGNAVHVKEGPRFTVKIGATEGETILSTNNKKPPFDNIKVRQAVAHALNREELIQGNGSGYGTPIGTHFSPANSNYVDLIGTYAYDPEKSKALLKEAGFENGFKATLKLPPPAYARGHGRCRTPREQPAGGGRTACHGVCQRRDSPR